MLLLCTSEKDGSRTVGVNPKETVCFYVAYYLVVLSPAFILADHHVKCVCVLSFAGDHRYTDASDAGQSG